LRRRFVRRGFVRWGESGFVRIKEDE